MGTRETIRRLLSGHSPDGKRSWTVSITAGAVVVAAGVLLSATVNPLLGRAVHWDWTASLATVLFVLIAVALRNRWV